MLSRAREWRRIARRHCSGATSSARWAVGCAAREGAGALLEDGGAGDRAGRRREERPDDRGRPVGVLAEDERREPARVGGGRRAAAEDAPGPAGGLRQGTEHGVAVGHGVRLDRRPAGVAGGAPPGRTSRPGVTGDAGDRHAGVGVARHPAAERATGRRGQVDRRDGVEVGGHRAGATVDEHHGAATGLRDGLGLVDAPDPAPLADDDPVGDQARVEGPEPALRGLASRRPGGRPRPGPARRGPAPWQGARRRPTTGRRGARPGPATSGRRRRRRW